MCRITELAFPRPDELGPFDFLWLGITAAASWEERYAAMVSPIFHELALALLARVRERVGWRACVVGSGDSD